MINLPVSKSIGARYLVATFFSGTLPADPVFEDSDDLRVLQNVLLNIYADEEPIDYGQTPLDVHASGTAMRFVTAVCASTPGADYVVTGTLRLLQRPMTNLLKVLREAGAEIIIQGPEGTGPYRITGRHLEGGEFVIAGDVSSQFISALMLVAPTWEKGIRLKFTTEMRSFPYVRMTARVMEHFGLQIDLSDREVEIKPATYKDPGDYHVEADWSAAAFFFAAAAYSRQSFVIAGLTNPEESLQGDSRVAEYVRPLGVTARFTEEEVEVRGDGRPDEERYELNLSQEPDLVPALAVAAAISQRKFRFTGIGNLRFKESDRLEAIKQELGRLGYVLHIEEDELSWDGKTKEREGEIIIDPHDDHRIAMAFAFTALSIGEIRIKNPDVVEKSFLHFWDELPKTGLSCHREGDIMVVRKEDK